MNWLLWRGGPVRACILSLVDPVADYCVAVLMKWTNWENRAVMGRGKLQGKSMVVVPFFFFSNSQQD